MHEFDYRDGYAAVGMRDVDGFSVAAQLLLRDRQWHIKLYPGTSVIYHPYHLSVIIAMNPTPLMLMLCGIAVENSPGSVSPTLGGSSTGAGSMEVTTLRLLELFLDCVEEAPGVAESLASYSTVGGAPSVLLIDLMQV